MHSVEAARRTARRAQGETTTTTTATSAGAADRRRFRRLPPASHVAPLLPRTTHGGTGSKGKKGSKKLQKQPTWGEGKRQKGADLSRQEIGVGFVCVVTMVVVDVAGRARSLVSLIGGGWAGAYCTLQRLLQAFWVIVSSRIDQCAAPGGRWTDRLSCHESREIFLAFVRSILKLQDGKKAVGLSHPSTPLLVTTQARGLSVRAAPPHHSFFCCGRTLR
jgi:hypothetical protein